MNPIVKTLKKLDACQSALWWVKEQDTQDPQQLWDSCPEPEWLVWLIARTTKSEPFSEGRKPLTRCLLEIVKLIPNMPQEGKYCIKAIEDWLEGKISNEELKAVDDFVYTASIYYIPFASAATYSATAYITTSVAYYNDVKLAYNTVFNAIKAGVPKETCLKIVKKHFPNPPKI